MTQVTAVRDVMRLIAAASAIVFATAGAGTAFASFDSDNTYTGAYSDNNNETDVDEDFDFDFNNFADLNNDFMAYVDTGDNAMEFNTIGGNIDTGGVLAEVIFENSIGDGGEVLGSGLGLGWGGLDVDSESENNTTGAYSRNKNKLDVDSDFDYDSSNTAIVDNNVHLGINTGGNTSSFNTEGGDIETGDAIVRAEITNDISAPSGHHVGVGSLNSGTLDVSSSNGLTGFNSVNENKTDLDSDVKVSVDNTVEVNNDLYIDVDTGNNEEIGNTIGGHIDTGSARVGVGVRNQVR